MSERNCVRGNALRFPLLPFLVLLLGALLVLASCQPIQPVVETPAAVEAPASEEAAAPVDEEAEAPDQAGLDAVSMAARIDAARRQLPQVETLAGQLQLALPQTGSALAQVESNPFLQLFPELRQSAAPAWLQPGLRVTYYAQNAIFAETADDPAPSGAGFLQYDLVALDAGAAITSLKYFLAGDGGGFSPGFVTPSYGLPGVGDYWIAPQALARAEEAANPDLFVGRMPTTAAGREYNAVRFQVSAQGAEYVWMFDEASGLLLFHRYRIFDGAGESAQAGQIMLAGLRYIELPWQDAAVPQWVQPGVGLHYDGAYTVEVAGGVTPMPYAVDIAIQEVHPGWAAYLMSDSLYGRTSSSGMRVNGVAQLHDALWLPRAGLANLAPGQVLDVDPFTQVSLQVADVDGRFITLEETGSLHNSRITYDRRTGRLAAMSTQRQAGLAVIAIELHLSDMTAP